MRITTIDRPMVSIIMPCYNSEKYLAYAIESVINQTYKDWELIIVNDGSIDNSLVIAHLYQNRDNRIKVVVKDNGGYVSARLFGLKFISSTSKFLLFFDSDDILHPEMLATLFNCIVNNQSLGAVYCNHTLIDATGKIIGSPTYGIRMVPSLFGVRKLKEETFFTPFISIFCWATKMIEPMTLIRREAYENSNGWDIRFGKGRGNIGDGVLLFSEIALEWKVGYLKEPLYFYRKHTNQSTASSKDNKKAGPKVLAIWKQRIREGFKYSDDIKAAIIAYKYRFYVFDRIGSLKHYLRYKPVKCIALIAEVTIKYFISLRLIFYKDTKVFEE